MKVKDLPTVVYLSRGDSAVYVIGGETQVSVVFLHLDAETVAVCLLVVESLWIPQEASGCLRTCQKCIPVWFLCVSCKVEVFHVFIRVKGTGLNAKNHVAVHGYTSHTPRPANKLSCKHIYNSRRCLLSLFRLLFLSPVSEASRCSVKRYFFSRHTILSVDGPPQVDVFR